VTEQATPNQMQPNELVDGPRECRPHELAPVLDLINLVLRADAAKPPTIGRDWTQIYRPSNLANVRILKINHQIISASSIYPTDVKAGPHRIKVGGINGVVTHPDCRKRGLAGSVLRDCHAKMRADGCDIGLLSTVIFDWYRRFGWENGALSRTFTLDRNVVRYLPPFDAELVAGPVIDVPGIAARHDSEPFSAERSPETYRLLLERPHLQTFAARHAGRTVAYAVFRDDVIVEYGGPATDVAALIGELYRRRDDLSVSTSTYERGGAPRVPTPRIEVETPPMDEGLGHFLTELGLPAQFGYLGMIRIINARQLLGKIAPQITIERDDEDELALRDGSERLTMSRRDLVKLCFGPERITSFARGVLPVPFYQWRLDRV
jgi:hypothetical protein